MWWSGAQTPTTHARFCTFSWFENSDLALKWSTLIGRRQGLALAEAFFRRRQIKMSFCYAGYPTEFILVYKLVETTSHYQLQTPASHQQLSQKCIQFSVGEFSTSLALTIRDFVTIGTSFHGLTSCPTAHVVCLPSQSRTSTVLIVPMATHR